METGQVSSVYQFIIELLQEAAGLTFGSRLKVSIIMVNVKDVTMNIVQYGG